MDRSIYAHIDAISNCTSQLESLFRSFIGIAESGHVDGAMIQNLAQLGMTTAQSANTAIVDLLDCSRSVEIEHNELSELLSRFRESGEGEVFRELCRDLAVMVEQIARPAFQAITEMQNRAGDLDAMVRRARDVAGCLRVVHSANRDPNLPEIDSISRHIGEAMDSRTIAFAAAVARAKARRAGDTLDAA